MAFRKHHHSPILNGEHLRGHGIGSENALIALPHTQCSQETHQTLAADIIQSKPDSSHGKGGIRMSEMFWSVRCRAVVLTEEQKIEQGLVEIHPIAAVFEFEP